MTYRKVIDPLAKDRTDPVDQSNDDWDANLFTLYARFSNEPQRRMVQKLEIELG